MKTKSPYPKWVIRHRKPGTQIRLINGNYYLYKVTSWWDKKKKRPRMQTEGILGRIMPKRFIPSMKRQLEEQYQNITVREFGMSHWLYHHHTDLITTIREYFSMHWDFILSAVYCRLAFQAPMKRYAFHLQHSALRFWIKTYKQIKTISQQYSRIGELRHQQVRLMQQFAKSSRFTLVDVTPVFSSSTRLSINHLGYNSAGINKLQVNLLFIYSVDQQLPVYYKVNPGNVRDVIALEDALKESGLKNVVIVADKGFYSTENIRMMDAKKFRYLIPLKRNDTLIDYTPTQAPNKSGWDGYLLYQKRVIWYAIKKVKPDKALLLFLDEGLRKEEETDYVLRIEQGKSHYTMRNFRNTCKYFGTLALITNLTQKETPENIYHYWKTRNYIEQVYDTLKTALNVDTPYLREDKQLEGWMFVNYLAVVIWYRLLRTLKDAKLHPQYSPEDIMKMMLEIKQVKIGDEWKIAAVPKKYKEIMKKIGAPIV